MDSFRSSSYDQSDIHTYIYIIHIICKVGPVENRHPCLPPLSDTPRARPWRQGFKPHLRHVESTTCVGDDVFNFDAFFQENMNVHHTTIYPHVYIYIIIYMRGSGTYRESPRCSSYRDEAK